MGEGAWIIPEARFTAQHTAALADDFSIQMVQHIGDISYARGQGRLLEVVLASSIYRTVGWIWEYFFNLIQSTASRVVSVVLAKINHLLTMLKAVYG